MRRLVELICGTLAAAALAVPGMAQAPRTVRSGPAEMPISARAAATVVGAFHRALKDGNLEQASALLTGDALIYESGGVERGKAEYSSHHLPADAAFAKAVTRLVTRQSGDATGDLAWVATESRTTGSYKGRAIDSGGTETMILRREGNDWKIVHIHWSSAK